MRKTVTHMLSLLAVTASLSHLACASEKDKSVAQTEHKYTNHLIGENSPYLLAHAHNPVDWYPWGEEALAKAKREDKPIFLSIGYAACHWCHVMERESFENEQIAAVLNKHFISIKVDREQRPDLDQIYMSFTTAMTGGGGWPMSVFLTPDLKPFFAGTYFPPDDRYGRPGFMKVITAIAKTYAEDKQSIYESSQNIYQQVSVRLDSSLPASLLKKEMVSRTARSLMQNFDNVHGGFGNAPKFPHALELSLFLHQYKATGDQSFLNAAELALKAMSRGGIYDHVGGGFARYSTDARWLVPHFEKMLYDNALLVPVYVEAYQITRDKVYLDVVRETLDFILREMTDKTGGFYSSLDADSDGKEGKSYLWTKGEIDSLLGSDRAPLFEQYYNVTGHGNFEGGNILNVNVSSDRIREKANLADFGQFLDECKEKLLQARSRRLRPLTDDKILTSWNGLALSAFCRGYQVTGDRRYLKAAQKNASFIRKKVYRNGQLTHSYRRQKHSQGEFLEDYAFLIKGLLDLYETDHVGTYKSNDWLLFAAELANRATKLFLDEEGNFYLRPENESDLIMRPREERDGAIPAPGSIMIANLLKLNRITGKKKYLQQAEKALKEISSQIERYPGSVTSAVLAFDYYLNDKIEIVVVGQGHQKDAMLEELYGRFIPNRVIVVSDDGSELLPLFEGRQSSNGEVRAYVCRNSVCQLPVTTLAELRQQLDGI